MGKTIKAFTFSFFLFMLLIDMTKTTAPLKEPSQRQLRVGEQVRHIIVEALSRGDFPRATITQVHMSPDLKHARVYTVAMGGGNCTALLDTLNAAAPFFQQAINHGSRLKFTPRVRFVEDESFGYAARIEKLLENVAQK